MIELGTNDLTMNELYRAIVQKEEIVIQEEALVHLAKVYQEIQKLSRGQKTIYGINTGFGALAECKIPAENQQILQRNVLLSHAVGVGDPCSFEVAQTMLLLRLNTLLKGASGASPMLIEYLLAFYRHDIAPYVPKKGSVGASGDLAPLAHLGLLLLGEGKALKKDKGEISSREALEIVGLPPLLLGVRDGIALINGTQAISANAICQIFLAQHICRLADLTAAATLEAIGGHEDPFLAEIHGLKKQIGQGETAENLRYLIRERNTKSTVANPRTQDPYSLRCIPQIHGATKHALLHVSDTIQREINGVTDNPIFVLSANEELYSLSGGNFHGQYLALGLDYLAMAIAELANVAERRIENLLNPHYSNGLPPFLMKDSGLNSGFMMLHVTASALVNENRVLCHPASTDSIPTSANREDHVSMGMTSANKLWGILENTLAVLAIESFCNHQALDLRPGLIPGISVRLWHDAFRKVVPYHEKDALFYDDLTKLLAYLRDAKTVNLVSSLGLDRLFAAKDDSAS